jgi:hypothetical protein
LIWFNDSFDNAQSLSLVMRGGLGASTINVSVLGVADHSGFLPNSRHLLGAPKMSQVVHNFSVFCLQAFREIWLGRP